MESKPVITGRSITSDSIEFTFIHDIGTSTDIQVQVLASQNRMIPWSKISNSKNSVRIDLASLPKGSYTVIVNLCGKTGFVEKFIRY